MDLQTLSGKPVSSENTFPVEFVFGTDTFLTTEQLVTVSRCRTTKVFGTVSWVETEQGLARPVTGVLH